MKFIKFTESKPNNNEVVFVWFNGYERVMDSVDIAEYSESPDGSYWSCEADGEIFHPDEWCRIVPPSSFTPDDRSYISKRDIDLYNSIPALVEDMQRNPIKTPAYLSLCEVGALFLLSCIALVVYSIIF
jgi:hypothetical protein